jgi:hypothetical protein
METLSSGFEPGDAQRLADDARGSRTGRRQVLDAEMRSAAPSH